MNNIASEKNAFQKLSTNAPIRKNRMLHLDILRCIAAFFVIVNHTNSSIFLEGEANAQTLVSLAYFFLCRMAVPIFFMISGVLLLNKIESFKTVFHKRICKIMLPWISVSVLWYFLIPIGDRTRSIFDFCNQFFIGWLNHTLWFLYCYLGILIMLPFLQRLISTLDFKMLTILVLGWVLYSGLYNMLVNVYNVTPFTGYLQFQIFSGNIGYLFLGLWLSRLTITKRHIGIFVGVLSMIIGWLWAIIFTYSDFLVNGKWNLAIENIQFLPVILLSAGAFFVVQEFGKRKKVPNIKVEKIFKAFGDFSIGIYLLHTIVIKYSNNIYSFLRLYITDLLAMVLWEVFIFVVSALLSYVIFKSWKFIVSCFQKIIIRRNQRD